jgi:thymidylate kinase
MNNMLWVAFEGADGVGKTTTLHKVADSLKERSLKVECAQHPGHTPLGTMVRRIVKHQEAGIRPKKFTEQLLLASEFADFCENQLQDSESDILLSDRYNAVGAYVYGLANHLSQPTLGAITNIYHHLPCPELIFWLTCPELVAKERLLSSRPSLDNMDSRQHIARFYSDVFGPICINPNGSHPIYDVPGHDAYPIKPLLRHTTCIKIDTMLDQDIIVETIVQSCLSRRSQIGRSPKAPV